jgi:small subunit ribosomal protein S19
MAATSEVILKSKEVFYRGVNLEELKKLDVREVAKYLPSRARRSVLRGFNKIESFIKRCEETLSNNKKIRTHLRDIVVMPKMVGMLISVHTGKTFQDVHVSVEMIGHRLGEFAMTTQKVAHGGAGIGATKGSRAAKK